MNDNNSEQLFPNFLHRPAKLLLFSLGLFLCPLSHALAIENDASERDLLNLGVSSTSTTDEFDVRSYSLSYRNHRREWFWPWQDATSRSIDWGLDITRREGEVRPIEFRATHVQGILGIYLAPGVYVQGQAGKHELTTDNADRTIVTHGVTARLGQGSNVTVELAANKDFIYPDGAVPGGISERLSAQDYTASLRLRPHQRLRVVGKGNNRKFSDENFSRLAELSALYGLSPSWPWVWAGVGGQQLSYSRQVDSYWSPREFKALGLRFESSFPLGERLSASLAANLDWLDEDGSEGKGYLLLAGLQYRLYGQLHARLELNQSKSIQRASTWTSDSVFFSLSSPLF